MSNAVTFISAYNVIDARLRAIYKGKGSLQFSDLVRRCAQFHPTVDKYEEELLSYARLRNAIVHNSTHERIIAEPCDDVTQNIVHISMLLSDPPRLKVLKEKKLTGIDCGRPLSDAIMLMSEKGISNLPIYRSDRFIGLLNNRRIVRALGDALACGTLEAILEKPCGDVLRNEDMLRYYRILTAESTVQEALDAFGENKKLHAVIVTDVEGSHIKNLLTSVDLPELMQLLED